MITNKELRKKLSLFSELLEIHETDERLSKILGGSSYRIGQMTESVVEMDSAELKKNFRAEITKIIKELNETGTIEVLDELIQLTPPGIFEMMRIKGLGGKKIAQLWKTAAIDSADLLMEACKNGKLVELPGFGAKTVFNIMLAIEQVRSSEDQFHYATVADEAVRSTEFLKELFKNDHFSLCGEIRRKTNTVRQIEIITVISSDKFSQENKLKKYLIIQKSAKDKTTGNTANEIPFVIYHSTKKEYFLNLFRLTGSEEHVNKVLEKIKAETGFDSEEEIYEAAGFNYVVPEMRENTGELHAVSAKKKIDLVELSDIKGVVHNHTTYSDGVDTLKDFVTACKKKKFEYVVISDHSKNAHYAGGLKEDQVIDQQKEIDKLNKEVFPFKIFKSIECDILVSGELDYPDEFLKRFDLVIISVHQQLKMDKEKATKRLLRAIENPYTTILGHMTGRQLLIRPGFPLDFKKIIDACAANNVIIEINANPYRLDVDWSHIPYILKKGVMISVNPDAHSIGEIDNIKWGIESARKGGLTKDMTWNALGLKEIEKWLKENKK